MSEFTIVDKKGQWVLNTSEFGLADHQRQSDNPGSTLVIIQSGVPTRIDLNDYLRAQPTLQLMTVDPVSGDEIELPEPPQPAPAPSADAAPADPVADPVPPADPVAPQGKKK